MVLVIVNFNTSVSTRILLEGSKWTRTGACIKAALRVLKLLATAFVYSNRPVFRPFSIPFKRSIKPKVT